MILMRFVTVLALVTGTVAVGAGPAAAAYPTEVTYTGNWAGWAVKPSPTSAQGFRFVRATWTVRAATCAAPKAAASFWVGLDGANSPTIEQAGTSVDCANGSPYYYMWWEMFPQNEVRVRSVRPGDSIAASVSYDAATNRYTLAVQDTTQGTGFSVVQACPAGSTCNRSSAEIIAESPADSAGQRPLANYGYLTFNSISITDADGVAGSLRTSSPWIKNQIQQADGVVRSITGAHSTDGRNFGVTWQHV